MSLYKQYLKLEFKEIISYLNNWKRTLKWMNEIDSKELQWKTQIRMKYLHNNEVYRSVKDYAGFIG